MKTVHPRLITGSYTLLICMISILLELTTELPLFSKNKVLVGIVALIPGVIIGYVFSSKYDPDNNDNKKVIIFDIISFTIFFIIVTFYFFKR